MNKTKRKLSIKAKLIPINNPYINQNPKIIAVGRIHKGIMELNLAFGCSTKIENSVKHNDSHFTGGDCHSDCHKKSPFKKQLKLKKS